MRVSNKVQGEDKSTYGSLAFQMMETGDTGDNPGCPCMRSYRGRQRRRASWGRDQNPFEQGVKVAKKDDCL